jgi:AcrR family transcriptional regulator
VDEIIAQAGVAKATFYRHFSSKNDLILAFLKKQEPLWTHGRLEAETLKRASSPRQRLLTIFDLFDEWFQRDDFEGCPFIGTVVQFADPADRVHKEAVFQLSIVGSFVLGLAKDAGVARAEEFPSSWQLLMEGSILRALAGDRTAAKRARGAGEALLSSASASPA